MKQLFLTAWLLVILSSCSDDNSLNEPDQQYQETTDAEILPFRDTSLSTDVRVDDLVGRLTTTEKIAQMFNDTPAIEHLDIPAYNWWNESLHGVARAGTATVFPQAIGMAATFDEALMLRVATAISDEGRAKYHDFQQNDVRSIYAGLTFWSPNINIFRDPRWGRGQETYGEDPYLTGRMAVNFINGLQGDDENYLKSVATIKHYAVHSGPEKTRHVDDYRPSRKDLFETYLPAFRMAIAETKVASLMCAYNRVDGSPACGNNELMQDILRGDMGFDGYVVSDCGAIADFYDKESHNVVSSPAEAAAWAVKSGTDINCGDSHGNTFTNLHYALYQGLITEAEIDVAVKRLFKARFLLGMFDPQEKVPYSDIPTSIVASEKHIALSQEASEKSLVLLKNDGILPLQEGIKVAVIGPNAINHEVLVGNYNGLPSQAVLPLQGIVDHLGQENVTWSPGAPQIGDVYAHHEVVGPENFFHIDNNGEKQPGLIASFYKGNLLFDSVRDDQLLGDVAHTQVDKNVDFHWIKSPLDGSREQTFAVAWRGKLQPSKNGVYDFSGSASINIDGEWISKPIALNADTAYDVDIRFANNSWWPWNAIEPVAQLSWLDTSVDIATEALAAASRADIVIYMGGIDAHLEGEEMPLELDGFTAGDRTHIRLPKEQTELLKKLKIMGKPIVMVNFSGSAMALNWENQNVNAIVQAFYPGEKAGTAIANLLWGDVNPSGRLPVTFYKSVDDLPAFTDYGMENRTYKYYRGEPLYPFGYGLSYTQFAYSGLDVVDTLGEADSLTLKARLTNTGEVAGEEVVQLYLSFIDAPVATPIRELKSFRRVSLAAGESTELEFVLSADELRYVDEQGEFQVHHGDVQLTLGSGQKGYVADQALVEKIITLN